MLICQSKVNLDEKILFGDTLLLTGPEIRKNAGEEACQGTKIPHSIVIHDLPSIEIRILFLKLAMQTSMPHKSWTRMECGISILIQTRYRHFPIYLVLTVCDFPNKIFSSKIAFDS